MTEQWWVLGSDRRPVGPVTTDLLVKGISAGKVPTDSLVCVVGGAEWQSLSDLAPFAPAVKEARSREIANPPRTRQARKNLLELEERTIVDGVPLWPSEPQASEPDLENTTLKRPLASFEEEEHTIVDSPFRPSDPPE